MNDIQEILKGNIKIMGEVAENLMTVTAAFNTQETKINLMKAQLTASGAIVNLPNQGMREAAIEERLQRDDMYKDEYRLYTYRHVVVVPRLQLLSFLDWVD